MDGLIRELELDAYSVQAGVPFQHCHMEPRRFFRQGMLITHFAAERMRASPRVTGLLNKTAGTMLVGFGLKLAISK